MGARRRSSSSRASSGKSAPPAAAAAAKAPRPPAWVKALRLDDEKRALIAATIGELAAVRDDEARGRGRVVDAYADALGEDAFDVEAVEAAVGKRDDASARATKKRIAAMKRVHRALDEDQRALLAVLVRAGLLPL
jgi:hypothetical protein